MKATQTFRLSLEQIQCLREGQLIQFQQNDWEIVRIVRPDPVWQDTDPMVFLLFRMEVIERSKGHPVKRVSSLLVTEWELKTNAQESSPW